MNDDHDGRATTRLLTRVLDGPRRWGSVEAGPQRQGFRRYRLVLFPPGVTTTERRLLRLWRALPTWVAMLWLLSVIVLTQVCTPWVALATATAIYLGVGVVTFERLGVTRTRVRTLSVVLIAGYSDPAAAATYVELKTLAITLFAADALLEQGQISLTEHESIWWDSYERVETHRESADHESV